MEFVLVLAIALFGSALVAAWRIHRELPWTWRALPKRAVTLLVAIALAAVAWYASLLLMTWGTYVCMVCGRTERQTRVAGLPCSWVLKDSGEAYAARFLAENAREHWHNWHLESCLWSLDGVACTMETVRRWFETLPKLSDRALADALYREAETLDRGDRGRFMDGFGHWIGLHAEEPGGIDAAAASWSAEWQVQLAWQR